MKQTSIQVKERGSRIQQRKASDYDASLTSGREREKEERLCRKSLRHSTTVRKAQAAQLEPQSKDYPLVEPRLGRDGSGC